MALLETGLENDKFVEIKEPGGRPDRRARHRRRPFHPGSRRQGQHRRNSTAGLHGGRHDPIPTSHRFSRPSRFCLARGRGPCGGPEDRDRRRRPRRPQRQGRPVGEEPRRLRWSSSARSATSTPRTSTSPSTIPSDVAVDKAGPHLRPRHREHPHPEVRARRRVPGHDRPQGPGAGRVHHARRASTSTGTATSSSADPAQSRLHVIIGGGQRRPDHRPQGRADLRRPISLARRRLRRPGLDLRPSRCATRPGRKIGEMRLFRTLAPDGRITGSFGELDRFWRSHDQRDGQRRASSPSTPATTLLVSFNAQNRIEKYGPDGKLLWRADRPLELRHGGQEEGQGRDVGGRRSRHVRARR